MTTFRHTHASLRFSRSVKATLKALAWHRERCDLLTVTEIGNPNKADVLEGVPGWGSFRGRGPGRETGVTWDKSVWQLVAEPLSVPIATETYRRKNGDRMPLRRAPVVHLRHRASGRDLFVLAVHLPSSVEGVGGLSGKADRVAAYESALQGLGEVVDEILDAWPDAALLVSGDWNLNLRRAWVRDLLEGSTGLVSLWDDLESLPSRGWRPGTKRIIDGSLGFDLTLRRGWIWAKRPASDHRPIHNVVAFAPRTRGEHVEAALEALDAALEAAEGNRWRTKRVSRAREWLHKIKPRR